MADINTGQQIRFENGGEVLIGSDTLMNIVEGTLRMRVPREQPIVTMDRGKIQGVIVGNERESEIELDIRVTPGSKPEVLDAVAAAHSSGAFHTFGMTIKVFDYRGASTGDQWAFTSAYLPDGYELQAGSGEELDRIRLVMRVIDPEPTYTELTA